MNKPFFIVELSSSGKFFYIITGNGGCTSLMSKEEVTTAVKLLKGAGHEVDDDMLRLSRGINL